MPGFTMYRPSCWDFIHFEIAVNRKQNCDSYGMILNRLKATLYFEFLELYIHAGVDNTNIIKISDSNNN
jgi:hypothetical protein